MKVTTLALLFGVALASACGARAQSCTAEWLDDAAATGGSDSGSVFLTPLIEAGNLKGALEKSAITNKNKSCEIAKAFSGYITVDKATDSHLFFVLVKSQRKGDKAPLILWLQGGPGSSSLLGQFLEHGPVGINADGRPYRRKNTLQTDYDILYLDQPVGAGYSFTKKNGYAKSLEDMAKHMEEFLRQFLKLFSEYRSRDFYVCGESYGARPAAALAARLDKKKSEAAANLKLKGVVFGVGLFRELLKQVDVSEYLRHLGLVDQTGYKTLQQRMQNIKYLISQGSKSVGSAMMMLSQTFGTTRDFSKPKLFFNLTNYPYQANALQPCEPLEFVQYRRLMERPAFKKSIHAGVNATFRKSDHLIKMNLVKDSFRNISAEVQLLVQRYRVLVYVGQLDIMLSPVATEEFLRGLKWPGADKFANSVRRPWWRHKTDGDMAGHVREVGNLIYVTLRLSGHYPFHDQPDDTCEMMRRFIERKPLISKIFDPKKGQFVAPKTVNP